MKRFLSAVLFLLASQALAETRAKVDLSQKKEAGAYQIRFLVFPASQDLKLNMDAPWRLQVKAKDAAVFPKTNLQKADFDSNLPGFVLQTGKLALKEKMTVPYELTAFTCTKDRSQCFRELIKGDFVLSP